MVKGVQTCALPSYLNEQVTSFQPGTVRDIETYPKPFDVALLSPKDAVRSNVFTVDVKTEKGGVIAQEDGFSMGFEFGKAIELTHIGQVTINRRWEEHTSELQSLIRISYAVFCLTNKKKK